MPSYARLHAGIMSIWLQSKTVSHLFGTAHGSVLMVSQFQFHILCLPLINSLTTVCLAHSIWRTIDYVCCTMLCNCTVYPAKSCCKNMRLKGVNQHIHSHTLSLTHTHVTDTLTHTHTHIQKWHERYFVLRANKTFECYKSRKAAETSKSPRRTIDLRECINLEVGLEYKSLQHILSLGTFKRAFFVAAPSDALMLQWANVLEKVKNAQEGNF